MTYYEELRNKAENCRMVAAKTKGRMRDIWLAKASQLEETAGNLPLVKATEIVK